MTSGQFTAEDMADLRGEHVCGVTVTFRIKIFVQVRAAPNRWSIFPKSLRWATITIAGGDYTCTFDGTMRRAGRELERLYRRVTNAEDTALGQHWDIEQLMAELEGPRDIVGRIECERSIDAAVVAERERWQVEIGRLRAALKICAADWISAPSTVTCTAQGLADEFRRRMEIADVAIRKGE